MRNVTITLDDNKYFAVRTILSTCRRVTLVSADNEAGEA